MNQKTILIIVVAIGIGAFLSCHEPQKKSTTSQEQISKDSPFAIHGVKVISEPLDSPLPQGFDDYSVFLPKLRLSFCG